MKQRITLWFATLLLGIVAMAQPVKKSQEEFEKGYQAFIIQQAQLTEKEAVTNEGGVGGKIRFLTNIMGSWIFQELRRVWNEEGKNLSFNDMEQMARASEPCKYFINPNCSEFAAPGDMPGNIRAFLKA